MLFILPLLVKLVLFFFVVLFFLLLSLLLCACSFFLFSLFWLRVSGTSSRAQARARRGAIEKGSANAEEAGSAQLQIETGHQLYGIVQDAQQGGHLHED